MASSKIKGITIEIGGDTTKLGKAIADSEKKSRSLQGELKQVEKLLKMDPGNVELLAQKQQILTEAVAETTKKLKVLEDAEEQVLEQFSRGDIGEDQLRAFQREIVKTKGELDNFSSQLGDTSDGIEDVGESAEESSDGFTIMGGALADLVASAIKGAISAIGDFIGSLMELSEATEEYRSMQSKLSGSAETFGYSVDFANEKYKEFYKYLGDDQASTNAITNLMGIGAETETVSKLAEGATAVWATYGDSIPIEALTESINETVTVGKVSGTMADTINWCKEAEEGLAKALGGNTEAQKAYKDALEEGLPVEDAFNEALAKITDEQERADVVAKFLNDTYGESKTAYDEMSDSMLDANEAELKLKDTQAELGQTMEPVNTALTDMKNQALEAIAPLVERLADGFAKLYEWLQKNPVVMHILVALAIALATAFGVLAGALAIQGLITGVTKAIAFLNTTLLANPIVWVVALIAGLVGAFIYLWNNCDAFRQFWINLWAKIKEVAGIAWEAIKKFFSQAWIKIKEVWAKAQPYFLAIWNKIKSIFAVVKPVLLGFFKSAWTAIKAVWSVVTGYFKAIWNTIKGIFAVVKAVLSGNWRDAWNAIKSIVGTWVNYFKNVWSKIKNVFSSVGSWFKSTFSKAWTAVKNVFSGWGSFFGGLWNTIKNKFSSIGTNIANAIGGAVRSGINGVISSIERTINSGIGLINGAIGLINKLPGVNVGKIGTVSFPRLARGGIVDRPTLAEIGEDGAEAVIPLERNTEWLRVVAQGLGDHLRDESIGSNNTALLNKLDGIYERLNRLQIVLDTGTLVGETIDKIDAGLANKQILSARGV